MPAAPKCAAEGDRIGERIFPWFAKLGHELADEQSSEGHEIGTSHHDRCPEHFRLPARASSFCVHNQAAVTAEKAIDVPFAQSVDANNQQVPLRVADDQEAEQPKRVVITINCSFTDKENSDLHVIGVGHKYVRRFGTAFTQVQQVKDLLGLIRRGNVVWLHAVVNAVHWAKPTWLTKLCRAAHRAGVNWTLRFGRDPLGVKPFEALRRHKYVQHKVVQDTARGSGLHSVMCTE